MPNLMKHYLVIVKLFVFVFAGFGTFAVTAWGDALQIADCLIRHAEDLEFTHLQLGEDRQRPTTTFRNSTRTNMEHSAVEAMVDDAMSTAMIPSNMPPGRIPVMFSDGDAYRFYINKNNTWFTIQRVQTGEPPVITYALTETSNRVPPSLHNTIGDEAIAQRLQEVRSARTPPPVVTAPPASPPTPPRPAPTVPIAPSTINSNNVNYLVDHYRTPRRGPVSNPISGGHTAESIETFFQNQRMSRDVTLDEFSEFVRPFQVSLPGGRLTTVYAYRMRVHVPGGTGAKKVFFSPVRVAGLTADRRGLITPVAATFAQKTDFNSAMRVMVESAWVSAATELSLPGARARAVQWRVPGVPDQRSTVDFRARIPGATGQYTEIPMRGFLEDLYADSLTSVGNGVAQVPGNGIRFGSIFPTF